MSNSPPAKVKSAGSEPEGGVRVLGAGVDSLVVAMQVYWREEGFLDRLAELRVAAEAEDRALPLELCTVGPSHYRSMP